MRRDFLRTVSHELRTPMTPLIGHLDLLADDIGPENSPALERLRRIQGSADRVMERISEMLTAAELRVELRRQRTEVAQLIQERVAAFSSQAEAKALRVTYEGNEECWAEVDAARMVQAFDEILSNAIKFSDAGTAVVVTCSGDAEVVRITVVDEGPGVTTSEQNRAFDAFYRTPHARRQAVQGFGLGLSVAKNIVDAHAGTIAVRSRPEGGLVVVISVPRVAPDPS